MGFKYKEGDFATYTIPELSGSFLFIVDKAYWEKCRKDIIPHKYYSGRLIKLEMNEDGKLKAMDKLTQRWRGTPIMDVPEKELKKRG